MENSLPSHYYHSYQYLCTLDSFPLFAHCFSIIFFQLTIFEFLNYASEILSLAYFYLNFRYQMQDQNYLSRLIFIFCKMIILGDHNRKILIK